MNTVQSQYSQSASGGLRDYMVFVYQSMALALSITGVVAFVLYQMILSSPSLANLLFKSPLSFIVMFAPLGMALFLGFRINHIPFQKARALFFAYSFLMGISLSTIFLAYTGESIARAFFVTAGTFAGMSLYGYTTKRDLTAFGSFLVMALIGIIIASIVNIFLKSSGMGFAISVLSVLIFTGLTAYDVQRIKEMFYHYQSGQIDDEGIKKVALMGAFSLYLDFINIFIHLLHLFGDRK
jgi:uncharacterized protein